MFQPEAELLILVKRAEIIDQPSAHNHIEDMPEPNNSDVIIAKFGGYWIGDSLINRGAGRG